MSIKVSITVWSEVQSLQSHQVYSGLLQSSHVHTRPHWTGCLVHRDLIISTLNRIEYNYVTRNVKYALLSLM